MKPFIHEVNQFINCKKCGFIAGVGYIINGDGFYCYHCHKEIVKETFHDQRGENDG